MKLPWSAPLGINPHATSSTPYHRRDFAGFAGLLLTPRGQGLYQPGNPSNLYRVGVILAISGTGGMGSALA